MGRNGINGAGAMNLATPDARRRGSARDKRPSVARRREPFLKKTEPAENRRPFCTHKSRMTDEKVRFCRQSTYGVLLGRYAGKWADAPCWTD